MGVAFRPALKLSCGAPLSYPLFLESPFDGRTPVSGTFSLDGSSSLLFLQSPIWGGAPVLPLFFCGTIRWPFPPGIVPPVNAPIRGTPPSEWFFAPALVYPGKKLGVTPFFPPIGHFFCTGTPPFSLPNHSSLARALVRPQKFRIFLDSSSLSSTVSPFFPCDWKCTLSKLYRDSPLSPVFFPDTAPPMADFSLFLACQRPALHSTCAAHQTPSMSFLRN